MCKQSFFSNAIYKLFRGNLPRQNPVVTCSARNFIGKGREGAGGGGVRQLSRVSCSARNYSGKNVQGEKSRRKLPSREFHGGQLSRV